MNVIDAIKSRKSIRNYKESEIEEEKLKEVLEAGRLAPSASNRQEWRFVVVRDKNTRKKLCAAANNQPFVEQAPAVIVICAETDGHTMRCGEKCYPIDCAIAIDHMTLRAAELGLGTCWVGSFYQDQVKKTLGIPEKIVVVELLAIGYPSSYPEASPRRKLEEILHYEKW